MKMIVRAVLIAVAALVPALLMTGQAHAVTSKGFPYLSRGQSLLPPNYLYTPLQNAYYVIMQGDGNLVEYGTSSSGPREGACWSTGTWGHQGAYATYENSGNLIITDETGRTTLWSSHTAGQSGTTVNVTNTGALWIGNKEIVGPEPACNGPSPS
jgi:hypothetical protein